jgi:restriction endonuclease S subunit
MAERLKEIASIQMGHPFRSRLKMDASGNVHVLQMKDIDEYSRLNTGDLVPATLPEVKDIHRIEKGDILFRSRGRANTAALVEEQLQNVVVAAPLFRIRVDDDKVLPAYLAWYINQPRAQAYIERHASGTISRMIHKKALEDMEFDLPTLERQKQIIAIAQLAAREQDLLQLLAEKRKSYINGILMELASKR